jgi:hypothetical protein
MRSSLTLEFTRPRHNHIQVTWNAVGLMRSTLARVGWNDFFGAALLLTVALLNSKCLHPFRKRLSFSHIIAKQFECVISFFVNMEGIVSRT